MESLSHVGHILHHLPFGKKLVSALEILAADVVTTKEMLNKWSHQRHHHDKGSPPNLPNSMATRLGRSTFCASHISASVRVGDAPFDGGKSPQVRAIDAALASLVHLEELFMEGTDLEGVVPKGVCDLRNTK